MPYRRSNGSPPEAFRAVASEPFTLRTGASSSYLGSRAGGVPSSPPAVAPSRILRVCSSTTGLNTTLSPSRRHISSLTARHWSMMSLGSSAFRCFPYRDAAHTMMWSCRWCRSVCVATIELVFAARDPTRELHAELVHPLGRHGVVGAEAQLDVIGQTAVLPDAFRRPAVVVEHAFGQRVVVRPGPLVVGADQSSSVGLGGV